VRGDGLEEEVREEGHAYRVVPVFVDLGYQIASDVLHRCEQGDDSHIHELAECNPHRDSGYLESLGDGFGEGHSEGHHLLYYLVHSIREDGH